MRRLYCILILFALFTSCKKDTPKFTDVTSPLITKYVINLSGNKINFYSEYLNDSLVKNVVYTDLDTTISVVTTNNSGNIINTEIFFIGDNGYADSSVVKVFNDYGLYYRSTSKFKYENDYLVQTTLNFKQFGAYPDSGIVQVFNTISSDNIVSTSHSLGCINKYSYNDYNNLIDVEHFSNGIKGKINKNLILNAQWNCGCPSGPSMSIAFSEFEYQFNSNNYVTLISEKYTPSYHTFDTEEVKRTIQFTIFEYN